MIIICTKVKKEQNVKTCYEFGNDPMKIMYFKHKIKMKVNCKINKLKLPMYYFHINCDF